MGMEGSYFQTTGRGSAIAVLFILRCAPACLRMGLARPEIVDARTVPSCTSIRAGGDPPEAEFHAVAGTRQCVYMRELNRPSAVEDFERPPAIDIPPARAASRVRTAATPIHPGRLDITPLHSQALCHPDVGGEGGAMSRRRAMIFALAHGWVHGAVTGRAVFG